MSNRTYTFDKSEVKSNTSSFVGTHTAHYAYSSDRSCMRRRWIRIQLHTHTAVCGGFDHIYRNLVMQSSRLDYNRTLLLLIGEAFIMLSYILECVRSLLKECDIVFIDE